MKKCNKCKIEKSLDSFYNHPKTKDGKDVKCKECTKLYKKENWKTLSQKQKITDAIFRVNNPNYYEKYWKGYYNKNKNLILAKHKEKQPLINEYHKIRRNTDPIFKLKGSIRNLIKDSFLRQHKKGWIKSKHSEEILGCTLEEFIHHLQSKFTEGMTLENHGKWEIDHIIPLASAKNEKDVYKLNHYTNLQPLWKEDNRSKGDKFIKE
jgi:hypothetical protein